MPVFIVIASTKPNDLERIITSKIASTDNFRVDQNTWLISPPANVVTPKELSDFLDISQGSAGQIFISILGAYYGYHNREMWAWISSKGA